MKEFITAVEDIEAEDASVQKIKDRTAALTATFVEEGMAEDEAKAKARTQAEKEAEEEEGVIEFKVDGRALKAYPLTDGQLAFMMASLGRGQSDDSRLSSIINIMLASMRAGDKDYLEGRLLLGKNDPKRLPIKQIEEIFEYLIEEWFARPTQPSSDSA